MMYEAWLVADSSRRSSGRGRNRVGLIKVAG